MRPGHFIDGVLEMRRMALAIAVISCVGITTGCSRSSSNLAVDAGGKAALEDLAQLLKSLADEGRKPPTKLADLDSVEPMIPVAAPAIRSGDIVYVWGAGYAAKGLQVVAYEKKAATDGGYVLLQDGTTKTMTAAEFQSAPKAK
jgi:hypothetical protein